MNYDGSLEFYFMNSLSALISETLVKDIFIRLDIRNFSEGYFHLSHPRSFFDHFQHKYIEFSEQDLC